MKRTDRLFTAPRTKGAEDKKALGRKKNKQIILTTETHGLTLKSKARSPPNTDWH
jgi:hypothetical protein